MKNMFPVYFSSHILALSSMHIYHVQCVPCGKEQKGMLLIFGKEINLVLYLLHRQTKVKGKTMLMDKHKRWDYF